MNVKRLLVTTLAGAMLIGSIGVYASSIPQEVEPEGIGGYFQMKSSQSSEAIKSEYFLKGAQELTGDLPFSISFTDSDMVEGTVSLENTSGNAKSVIASSLIEGIERLKFSELSQELQERLIENYGDLAYGMTFTDEQMAEKIANAEISVHMVNPSTMTISATKLTTETQEK